MLTVEAVAISPESNNFLTKYEAPLNDCLICTYRCTYNISISCEVKYSFNFITNELSAILPFNRGIIFLHILLCQVL